MNLKKFILILNIVLTLGIAAAVFYGYKTWQNSNTPSTSPVEKNVQPPVNTAHKPLAQKGLEYFQPVVEKDIFQTKKEDPQGTAMAVEEPRINLNEFELKGTVVGENMESFAFILRKATRDQRIYYLRDRIQGAIIAQIQADQVVFDLGNGRQDHLFMAVAKDPTFGTGFEPFRTPAAPPLPPLPKIMPPQQAPDAPVIKNLRPKPIEMKKRPLS